MTRNGPRRGGADGRHDVSGARRALSRSTGRSGRPTGGGADSDDGRPWSRHAELEEMPALAVAPGRPARPRMAGAVGALAVVGLLAAGLGFLGGREVPQPSLLARPTSTPPVSTPIVVTPRMTPWAECAAPPTAAPDVLLEVAGNVTRGTVEVLWSAQGIPASPAAQDTALPEPSGRVQIPVDIHVISELWIVGAACATAWDILLVDAESRTSIEQGGEPGDLQNRFSLRAAPFVGEYVLQADLTFPTLGARVSWPVELVKHRADGVLAGERDEVVATEGCDVFMTLFATGDELALHLCEDDLDEAPAPPLVVRPGEMLEFTFDGWAIEAGRVACGEVDGQAFVGPATDCRFTPSEFEDSIAFAAPPASGVWTLAIEACAWEEGPDGPQSRLCGTWYADVDVRR